MLTGLLFFFGALAVTALTVWLTGISPLWGLPLLPVIWFLLLILGLVWIRLGAVGVDRTKPLESLRPRCKRACGSWGDMLCFYLRADVHVVGEEKLPKDRRFLYVSNHRSGLDPLIVMGRLKDYDISFVSKPSNMDLPLIGAVGYAAGFLAIDRENDRKALKTILTAADYLKRDLCSIGIYPEGTRSKTGELLPFHAGSFKIAQRAGVPVVVACVKGTEALKRHPLRRKRVDLKILALLEVEQIKSMSTRELSELCRDMIQAELNGEADA